MIYNYTSAVKKNPMEKKVVDSTIIPFLLGLLFFLIK